MIIERAILHEMVAGRDGHVTQPYERPAEVRASAQRVRAWQHGTPEGCHRCRANQAHVLRTGRALCAVCVEAETTRVAPVTSPRGLPVTRQTVPDPTVKGIVGHFIVFDRESLDLGGFIEIIRPSAVDRSLAPGQDVRALWGHDSGQPIGRTGPRTLTLHKDRVGLYGQVEVPTWGSAYLETVERGDVTGASFGFSVLEDEWHFTQDEMVIREIFDMTIFEVSPVAFPAYPDTRIRVERLSERMARDSAIRLQLAR